MNWILPPGSVRTGVVLEKTKKGNKKMSVGSFFVGKFFFFGFGDGVETFSY
jgi:hypothetical protein